MNRADHLGEILEEYMASHTVKAYAAKSEGGTLEPYEYELPEIGPEQVDIKVETCGLCHSDLSMLDNEWGMTEYPFVPGHEVVGTIIRAGEGVKHVKEGQRVGLGWNASSCMHCDQCMDGHHHLCPETEGTIVGRFGGFADTVRCQWAWALPIPDGLNPATAGPLFCGGITVFNPIANSGIAPTGKAGVIGIGGLGHLALQFLNKWGCEVTAFTSSPSKEKEALEMGAHNVINSRDEDALKKAASGFDLIINTTNVSLDWDKYIAALKPQGRLHTVGAVLEPMPVQAFSLIGGEKSVAGSPLGSPLLNRQMLEFCARHGVETLTEEFAMKDINDAFQHLRDGKPRYRIVLKN